ncbi:nucleotidyltransferase family protein [Arthrobacter sp. AL08]|nr:MULTISPECIES: nucleotidyltransferase family protein [unclassified Arthrobacter]MDI3243149.1 nucleotidyltransferase family protein [Arthrobacter sp. AL05]MDI3279159.1 nucleotidyltransferase family protein [Arthrobacter sp. AL08]
MPHCRNDAIDSFAATACCVALTRVGQFIDLYAPFGLDDTIAMHLKPNRRLAPRSVYETKANQYRARWPQLTADPWEPGPPSRQSG